MEIIVNIYSQIPVFFKGKTGLKKISLFFNIFVDIKKKYIKLRQNTAVRRKI